MLKVIFTKESLLTKIWVFTKKMLISQICSNEYMRAKLLPRASESSAVYADHENLSMVWASKESFASEWACRSLRKSSMVLFLRASESNAKSSKPSMVWASEASFASKWAWRSFCKSSKPSKSSIVFAQRSEFREWVSHSQSSQTRATCSWERKGGKEGITKKFKSV